MQHALIAGISGVRGIADESLTPDVVAALARAFAVHVGAGPVLVGRDTRVSGPTLEVAAAEGLRESGCTPVLAGIVPTPTLCMLVADRKARGGIMISASHNPKEWNGLKFIGPNGLFLFPTDVERFLGLWRRGASAPVPEADRKAPVSLDDPMRSHFERILAYVDVESIRKRRFKVALDACNGVGAVHTRAFLEQFGCSVTSCFDTPDGVFGREAEPLPEHLGVLRDLTRREGCDIGFAQDPDGDRLAIVNELGDPIGEDMTVTFVVRQTLDHHEKGPVVVHLSTSRSVVQAAEARGCPVTRTRIGEINVVEAMLAARAVVGGEGNGGAIVPAVYPCRDSFVAMAMTLELMAMENKTVSALQAESPRYFMVKTKMDIPDGMAGPALDRLRELWRDRPLNLLDGLFFEDKDRECWVHLRASNTEPVLRIIAEARTQAESEALARSARRDVETALTERCKLKRMPL